ncbi:hypothetical protein CBR_g52297 [Chara braunii]|uniref:DUF4360 domain-containing protein n=1 Tax=Chara braunii TaxID=69332 RepID=A0A388MA33_CHABU|nr:hypothetical protein CBR_g52297 [Chara braunii]|eukprot:GBG91410.1 hypothetical protein CBR_g52297 [Chara braunii]
MVVLLLLGLLQLAVPGLAQTPPSGTVKIKSFKYAGSGCPPGSFQGVVSDDVQTLTVIFSSDTSDSGPERRSCQLSVGLTYPAGFAFTLESVTFRGSFQGSASVTTTYYFSGIPGTGRVQRSLPPPVEGNFEFTEQFSTLIHPECGSESVTLNIHTILYNSITVSAQIFGLGWTEC